MNAREEGPGRDVSLADLIHDPYPSLDLLRAEAPVAWVPALEAWLVTRHDLCVEVMLDADTYTVDDPRFSTQQVIGPSMLSLDGARHRRHRDPFAGPFRGARIKELESFTREQASDLVATATSGPSDLRADVAAPLAVAVMARVLDLHDVAGPDVLAWYQDIVDAVHQVTAGLPVPESGLAAFAALESAVSASLASSSLLGPVDRAGSLEVGEIVSNVAVLLFGGIVTSESSTAIAYRYLLADPGLQTRVRDDRSLVRPFVEEAFRIEPSAAAVDRYATRDVTLAGAEIAAGDLVRVSLTAGNRDPAVFPDPGTLDVGRPNLGKSLTFARGPHACLGIHLARLEAVAAVDSLLDQPEAVPAGTLDPVTGLVFRAPETVNASWPGIDPTAN
jgi:cytochrome P450